MVGCGHGPSSLPGRSYPAGPVPGLVVIFRAGPYALCGALALERPGPPVNGTPNYDREDA